MRHAETVANANGKLETGIESSSFTASGFRQVEALQRWFANRPVSHVASSQATRALDTARPIARVCAVPMLTLEDLNELPAAELEGGTGQSLENYMERAFVQSSEAALGHGWAAQRVEAFEKALTSGNDPLPPIIVSHGAILRLWLSVRLSDATQVDRVKGEPFPNGGVYFVEPTQSGWGSSNSWPPECP